MRLTLIILCFMMLLTSVVHAQEIQAISYEGVIWSAAYSSDRTHLIVITTDDVSCRGIRCSRQLYMLDMREGIIKFTLDFTGYSSFDISVLGDRFAMVRAEGFFGQDAAHVTITVEFRSMEDGSLIFERPLSAPAIMGDFGDTVTPHISFSDDLTIFYRQTEVLQRNYASGDIRELSIWDTESGELLFERDCETQGLMLGYSKGLLVSPDGQYVLYGCTSDEFGDDYVGVMELFELSSGEVIQKILRGVQNATVDWDNNSAYFLVRDNGFVKIHDLEREVSRIRDAGYLILVNRFTLDSHYFYFVSSEGTSVHIMNLVDGTTHTLTARELGGNSIEFAQISPDGTRLFVAVASNQPRMMRLMLLEMDTWNIIQETENTALHRTGISDYPYGEIWRDDGRYLALCASYADGQRMARPLYVWDIESNELLSIEGPETDYASDCVVAYSADERYIAYFRSYLGEGTELALLKIMELETRNIFYESNIESGEGGYYSTMLGWRRDDDRLMVINPSTQSFNFIAFP